MLVAPGGANIYRERERERDPLDALLQENLIREVEVLVRVLVSTRIRSIIC